MDKSLTNLPTRQANPRGRLRTRTRPQQFFIYLFCQLTTVSRCLRDHRSGHSSMAITIQGAKAHYPELHVFERNHILVFNQRQPIQRLHCFLCGHRHFERRDKRKSIYRRICTWGWHSNFANEQQFFGQIGYSSSSDSPQPSEADVVAEVKVVAEIIIWSLHPWRVLKRKTDSTHSTAAGCRVYQSRDPLRQGMS